MKFCRGHGGKDFHDPTGNIPGVRHGGAHLTGGRVVLGACLDLLILRKFPAFREYGTSLFHLIENFPLETGGILVRLYFATVRNTNMWFKKGSRIGKVTRL